MAFSRRAATGDTAFNHKLDDILNEELSDHESDDEVPETKNQYFEFSNSYYVMRFIKLMLYIQVIGIIVDHPALQWPIIFETFCRGILTYSLRFYSRPFIDVIYVIQYFWHEVKLSVESQHLTAAPSIEVTGQRRLNINPYGMNTKSSSSSLMNWDADFLNPHYWHSIRYFSHYFLTILFAIMAVAFTFRFWEISDYSNREEVKQWLDRYIADGWWRKGALNVVRSLANVVLLLFVFFLSMSAITNNFSINTFTNGLIASTIVVVVLSILGIVWVLGFLGIKSSEGAFMRYVSQNVAYTSAIILKRAIKAKFDLGLILLCSLFMPAVYTLLQSLLFFTDWNDTFATADRKQTNFFVPCYFAAFPPYREIRDPNSCPVYQGVLTSQVQPPGGYYFRDHSILQCDSYTGIALYVVSAFCFVLVCVGYFYLFYSLIHLANSEFKSSKWVDVLEKLIRISSEEEKDYNTRFSWLSILRIRFRKEMQLQWKHFSLAFIWLFVASFGALKAVILGIFRTLRMFFKPVEFFLGRLLLLGWLNLQALIDREDPKVTLRKTREIRERMNSLNKARTPPLHSTRGRGKLLSKDEIMRSQRAAVSKDVVLDDASLEDDEQSEHDNKSFKLGSSSMGGDRPVESSTPPTGSTGLGIGIDAEYTPNPVSSRLKEDSAPAWSLSVKISKSIKMVQRKLNITKSPYSVLSRFIYDCKKYFAKLPFVTYLRVKVGMFVNDALHEKREDGALAHGLSSLGANAAPWRKDLTLGNKTRLVQKLRRHVVVELRLSKLYFISDHELVIGFMDHTVDSSGLFTLVVLYNYDKMYWFLVVLFEMLLYPVVGAFFAQNFYWQDRNLALLFINIFFGVITYWFSPHTEDIDRWFEFMGRMLIGAVSVGLLLVAQSKNMPPERIPMFEPWKAWGMAARFVQNHSASTGAWVDGSLTIFFFAYVLYILFAIGVFNVAHRMLKAAQFSYHDHILDFIVEKAEEKTFGLENPFSGLVFVQQWDDIIKSQRRYALLTWPDVRPSHLVSLSAKFFEIKWASFFNLTLKNLRSSLGLTALHVTMFSAEGEITRWIMHANRELLSVMDSQNDTPITIALKECAYYLLCYGEQNSGRLDDGTSYEDDDFANYYPEVEELRDEIYNHGEFIKEMSIEYYITSEDLIKIREEGRYEEPSKSNYGSVYDDQGIPISLEFPENAVLPNQVRSKDQAVISWQQREEKRVLEQAKKKEKTLQARQRKERLSLYQKRFPEDSMFRNFESGQNSSWGVIGYQIPDENIFLDSNIIQRMMKFPKFRYALSYSQHEDKMRLHRAHHDDEDQDLEEGHRRTVDDEKEGDDRSLDEKDDGDMIGLAALQADDQTSHKFSSLTDLDLQYIVPSVKKVHLIPEVSMIVPLDHPKLRQFPDFDRSSDRRPDSARLSFKSDRHSTKSNQTNFSSDMKLFSSAVRRTAVENDRDVRYKICNFAAILLSPEISEACKDMTWAISDFKAFNKLASKNQGKIAQNLAFACHLNPPEGFVRISDWSRSDESDVFDENPETNLSLVVRGIVTVVQGVEGVIDQTSAAVNAISDWQKMLTAPLSSRPSSSRRSQRRRTTRSLAEILRDKEEGKHVEETTTGVLCDRIIQFLAEALACSTPHLLLDDCELSYNGRRGWRALVRALRQSHCSFVVPSTFSPSYPIRLVSLELPRNDFDCGDCVYIADILFHQLALRHLDLSFNRIGARGLSRVCKALREHKEIAVCKFNNNNVGPGAGQDIGLLLKNTKSLRCLDLNDNHLGEIVRYPTLFSREKLPSAAKFICLGLRVNKSIEQLNLANNHLGMMLASFLPLAVNKHPRLHTLDVSGNDLGPVHGPNLLFALAGAPLGAKYANEKEEFIQIARRRQMAVLKEKKKLFHGVSGNQGFSAEGIEDVFECKDVDRAMSIAENHGLFADDQPQQAEDQSLESSSTTLDDNKGEKIKSPAMITNLGRSFNEQLARLAQPAFGLTALSIADNQLGPFTGHAIASLLEKVRGLTHLDISGNALGPQGAEMVTDQIELLYGIYPREFLKIVLFEIEEKRFTGHNAKVRKKLYTNLCSLKMSRNNIGPRVLSSLAHILQNPNCGLVDLDISLNPLGLSTTVTGGSAAQGAVDLRRAMLSSRSLVNFNLHKTSFLPTELVTIFGGLAHHEHIEKLIISHIPLDEPACLQLGNVIEHCPSLTHLDLAHCRMGGNGGLIIAQKVNRKHSQLRFLDLSHNMMGPIAGVYLAEGLQAPTCSYRTLRIAGNDFLEDGGLFLAKALIGNSNVTYVDLSSNQLTSIVGEYLADAVRGQFQGGVKVKDSAIRTFIVNNNPQIGFKSARLLVKSLSNHHVEHIEISNIGAGMRTAEVIGDALRDLSVSWRYLDISENSISRLGMNKIFWASRLNRRLRALKISLNPVGSVFCSNEDALLSHGISVPVSIRENSVLRDLDLSFLALNSEAGINVIDAIIDNHTLKRLSLRGNQLDDNVALMLPDLFRCNNVLEELDLSHNKLGFACAFAIAESLNTNRSLKRLFLEYNRFGGSGSATLDSFSRSIMMNYSLQVLFLDGNKLGPEWGVKLSEAFVRNNTLTQVSLRDNRLDTRSGEALLNAFTHCPYLLELAVTADEIGYQVYEQFRRVFSLKRASIHPDGLVTETIITAKQSQLLSTYMD